MGFYENKMFAHIKSLIPETNTQMQSQRRKKLDFDDNFEDDELNLKKGSTSNFNPIQDGPFRPPPLRKICHTNPAKMKFGTVITYLKKTQKIYESFDIPLHFC